MHQLTSEGSATDKTYFCNRKTWFPTVASNENYSRGALSLIPNSGLDRLDLRNIYVRTTDFYFIHGKKKELIVL